MTDTHRTATVTKKRKIEPRERVDLRVDPDWFVEMATHADSMDMSLTQWIKYSCRKQKERDIAEREAIRRGQR